MKGCSAENSMRYTRNTENASNSRREILHACICNYVEERFLAEAHKDIRRILNKYGIEMEFPAVYVKNTAVVLVLNIPSYLQTTGRKPGSRSGGSWCLYSGLFRMRKRR